MNETIEIVGYKSFVSEIEPFNNLQALELDKVISKVDILYFKENEIILNIGNKPKYFYIILKGKVEQVDANGVSVDFLIKRDFFPAAAVMDGECKHNFTVLEEAICFAFPQDVFQSLLLRNKAFKKYFIEDFSQRVRKAITADINKEMATFMLKKIKDSLIRKAVVVDKGVTIYDAVLEMTKNKSSSVLLKEKEGQPYGLVTDTDLREKVILKNRPYYSKVNEIATNNLITIDKDDFLFNGMLLMIKHSVKRLVVTDNGKIEGVLEQIDLLGSLSHKSHLVDTRITKALSIEELKVINDDMTYLIKSLLATGVNIAKVQDILGELNIKLYRKLFSFVAPKELVENSCLLLLGSEGRKEQVLKTDQDNALILKDGYRCKDFEKICSEFTRLLLEFGYPECPGGVMVKNPYWSKSLKEFKEELGKWLNVPTGKNMLNLAILYDARVACGDSSLLVDLKLTIHKKLKDDKVLLGRFSESTLKFETPLSFFFGFIVSKKEDKKDKLDLKKGGIFPITHGVRSLALKYRIEETNTRLRIEELTALNVLSDELAEEIIQALDFLSTLRARIRLKKQGKQMELDNLINPYKLNKIERDILKDVFKIVDKFKKLISSHFSLELIP